MKGKFTVPASLSVAFVWFTTHFGGGFSSGRQIVEFFVSYGWFAVFAPIVSVGLMAAVYYYSWDSAVAQETFEYRSWGDKFFSPYEKILNNTYEAMYILILVTATAVVFATGGAALHKVVRTPYILNTIVLAVAIFLLTIFGADVVRGLASIIAVLVIAGMLTIYLGNLIVNFPQLMDVLASAPTPKGGFLSALWQMIVYAGFQVCLIGAFVAVADTLKGHKDAVKTAVYGFIVNAGILTLASASILSYYPEVCSKKLPVLYVASHGIGGQWAEYLVSILIVLAVVSTGVNLVYGGAKRIVKHFGQGSESASRKTNIIASGIYVVITWAIALIGLIGLIAKGYGTLGYLAIPLIIIPVLYRGIFAKNWSHGKQEVDEKQE